MAKKRVSWKVGEVKEKIVNGRIVRIKRISASGFPQYRILSNTKKKR